MAQRTTRLERPRASTKAALRQSPFTVVDLFAGAGGISEGFRQAGFSIVAGSDNDPDAVATYRRNFPEAEAISGDIFGVS